MSESPAQLTTGAAEKARQFPSTPGVYLMKDAQGRVIYVGKAKHLRNRASSYFQKTAAEDRRICDWIGEVADIDYLAADSEVDALLLEARLIKDIQPKHNQDLKDDKSFPYLADHDGRRLSARQLHPRAARPGRQALRPVPPRQEPPRRDPGLAEDFQVPDLLARDRGGRPALALVPPLPAPLNQPVHCPVQPPDRSRDLPDRHPAAPPLPRRQEGRRPGGDGRRDARGEQGTPVREGRAAPRRDQGPPDAQPPRRPGQARAARGLLHRSAQGLEGPEEGRCTSSRPPGRSTAWTSPTWGGPRRSARW